MINPALFESTFDPEPQVAIVRGQYMSQAQQALVTLTTPELMALHYALDHSPAIEDRRFCAFEVDPVLWGRFEAEG